MHEAALYSTLVTFFHGLTLGTGTGCVVGCAAGCAGVSTGAGLLGGRKGAGSASTAFSGALTSEGSLDPFPLVKEFHAFAPVHAGLVSSGFSLMALDNAYAFNN
jgi:hypothetical protein